MTERKKAAKKRTTSSSSPFGPNDHLVDYRGRISGLDSAGTTLVFTTEHAENQPTAIYQYDLDKKSLKSTPLDCGTSAQLLVEKDVWIAGTDHVLRRGALGKKPAVVGDAFDDRIVALAAHHDGVAAVAGHALHLVHKDGSRTSFDLGEEGRSVATDATGEWIVVGTTRGHVCVFNEKDGALSEVGRERLHNGEVTALAFSPEDLRVYSTGSDCRILISFVRGAFDSEDRSGNQSHEREIRAIQMGPDFETEDGSKPRFFTAGLDSTIKSWPRGRGGSQRPASMGDGVVQTSALAPISMGGKVHLAAAGLDGTIRIFAFDPEGRLTERVATLRNAYALATSELASDKPKVRQEALETLAGYADRESLEQIASHLSGSESDHKLQVKGVELLAGVDHARAPHLLETFFTHATTDVRIAAFKGLRSIKGDDDIDVLRLAISTNHEDLGLLAVRAAETLGHATAVDLIRGALDHSDAKVRRQALASLEHHYGDSADGTLAGLRSTHADLRRTAIVQLQKRNLLGSPVVDSRLRRLWDDNDDRARLWAFVVSAHRQPKLVKALRAADKNFHRHVFELEEFGKPENKRRKEMPAATKFDAKKLSEADFRPLLEAMGSRSIDVCLRGAQGLAALGDERSFGTLLQLSREPDASSRVAVCKALQVLGDPRSIKRVRAMLHDSDAGVRDAAFSALSTLQKSGPLDTAKAGLAAPAVDVRERALALLIKTAKATKGKLDADTRELLLLALNDSTPALRQEAFKSVWNLGPDGGGVGALRFILKSAQADVRNEALQEAKAKPKDAGFRDVLLEIINDADSSNRREAFDFALDRWPSSEHESVFEAALGSTFVDQRVAAVRKLSELKGDIRKLLVRALNDEDTNVRLEAVRALVQAENRALLAEALTSGHLDVRVEAGSALAALGDTRSLPTLLEVVDGYHSLVSDKANPDAVEAYKTPLQRALSGIAALGHPNSIDAVLSLLNGDASIANGAAAVLPAVAHPNNLEKVRAIADHELDSVRSFAALALTYNGDVSGAPMVFGKVSPSHQLFAALALREDSPERLLSFVDSDDTQLRNVALGLILALELSEHTKNGVPERCLSLLSAQSPSVRLNAAEALEHYSDQPGFYRWVYGMLNSLKSPADAWQAEPRVLLALSRAIALGEARLSVRAAQILAQLTNNKSDEFDRQWTLFESRYHDILVELEAKANQPPREAVSDRISRAWHRVKEKAKSLVVETTSFEEALKSLAFGAYIGLVRQRNDSHTLRIAAIAGLARLAPTNERFGDDAISVVLLALGDSNQDVRGRAFDVLQQLGASDVALSTEALSTGFSDMGFRGLELLASDTSGGNALLEKTMLQSTNGLENEAAKLLTERVGATEVNRIGLGAESQTFRHASVMGLAREYAQSPKAADALRGALDSRHPDVRFGAAQELAKRKDSAAFETLVEMLQGDDSNLHRRAITGFHELRDPRATSILLTRVEEDEDQTVDVSSLLSAAVSFGDVAIADRLLEMVDQNSNRDDAFTAALELTGFDQYEWVDDEEVTPSWEESLRPRHAGVFAQLFDLAYSIADEGMLGSLVGCAKWPAENSAIDSTLHALLGFSHDSIRHRAVEITGWRLSHRNGRSDGLKATLSSRDVLDQFYAAEGLALAGHSEGLAVLQTAVEAMDDWSLRERAVLALGRLAEPKTVDMLLALANDDEHTLQQPAAEAIGHMAASDRAVEVFDALKRLAGSSTYDTRHSAYRGLRWFGTDAAWKLLRAEAKSDNWWFAQKCVELLRFDEDSKDVVAEVLRENDDWDVAQSAAASLRHMWGPDSLEPDYLLMEANIGGLEAQTDALVRLRKDGDAQRILEVLARIHDENVDELVAPLVAILLSREPLPVDDAAKMLSSEKTRTASVAAQIIGRAGPEAAKDHGKKLVAAAKKAHTEWLSAWESFLANHRGAREKLVNIGERYQRLIWAAGQVQVGQDAILAASGLPDHELSLAIRESAVTTLGEDWVGSKATDVLVSLARGTNARLRSMAAAELERADASRSAELVAGAVHDDVSFGRLINALDSDARKPLIDALSDAADVALPRLAALQDVQGLAEAMQNSDLSDLTRHGAIDALSTIPSDEAASTLATFGANEDHDEMLRKAAWRARRRVTRAMARQEAP